MLNLDTSPTYPGTRQGSSLFPREILPLLSGGAEAFYDPRSGTLDPNFGVHMDQLRTLWEESSAIVIKADSLFNVVGTEVERLR